MPLKMTDEMIHAAIEGLEARREKLADQISELRAMLPAAARRKMAEAQRRRWAKVKGREITAPAAAPKKRKISAAGRKAIAEATRKRWAEYRAAKAAKPAKRVARKKPSAKAASAGAAAAE